MFFQKCFLVKIAIIRCNEKIKSVTEQYGKSKEELDEKVKLLLVDANEWIIYILWPEAKT